MASGTAQRLSVDSSALAELCRRWGIRELAVFGSALRSDFSPASDVDLLVDFAPGVVLGFRYLELERELSALFGGRRVDLVPRKYLHPPSVTAFSPRPTSDMQHDDRSMPFR
ncbi:MAG TPA: nucleotidyltransferase family protein [Thermoanaerobaculia bacterium]|nr:nucleotidyltransferase family protein [Thermoanaerobaculia bacterium]